MINKKNECYERMTMMRTGFNSDGQVPDLFSIEKRAVNRIMDAFDKAIDVTPESAKIVLDELTNVENSQHCNGSACYDFNLHLDELLRESGFKTDRSPNNKILGISILTDKN